MGNTGTLVGSSIGTYTVTPQTSAAQDYAMGYNFGLALRNIRDRSELASLHQVQQWWLSNGLKGDAIIPGENRQGHLSFVSNGPAVGPFKLVLFLTNPKTGAQQSVILRFE
jgi:hypothetical protein